MSFGDALQSLLIFVSAIRVVSPEIFVTEIEIDRSLNNLSNITSIPVRSKERINLTLSIDRIFHHNGLAYDIYSKDDLMRSKTGDQWKIWPLPTETNMSSSSDDINVSPAVTSNLSFVHSIYVLSDRRLTERHDNLKKAFDRQGIDIQSIVWRMRWNRRTCNSEANQLYVHRRLNLMYQSLGSSIYCSPSFQMN